MALTVDTLGTPVDTTSIASTTITISFANTAGDLLIVPESFWQTNSGTGNITGITYNGVALTRAVDQTVNTGIGPPYGLRSQIWYLIAPATGTNNLVITITSIVEILAVRTGLLTLAGADQTTPLDQTGTNTGTSSTLTSSVTTTANGEYIVDAVANFSGNDITKDGTQTVIMDFTSLGTSGGGSYFAQTSAGAKTMQWTSPGSDPWVSVAASFKAATVAVAASGSTFLMMGV